MHQISVSMTDGWLYTISHNSFVIVLFRVCETKQAVTGLPSSFQIPKMPGQDTAARAHSCCFSQVKKLSDALRISAYVFSTGLLMFTALVNTASW